MQDSSPRSRRSAHRGLSRTAAQALGYKEILETLEGRIGKDEAIEMIITRTRRFAVRQDRWFRRDPRVRWIDVEHDPVAEAAPERHRRSAPMTQLTLTKHHGLGNDFLVVFSPGSTTSRHSPGSSAIDVAESAPTGCWSPRARTGSRHG